VAEEFPLDKIARWYQARKRVVAGRPLSFWAAKEGTAKDIEKAFNRALEAAVKAGDTEGVTILNSLKHDKMSQFVRKGLGNRELLKAQSPSNLLGSFPSIPKAERKKLQKSGQWGAYLEGFRRDQAAKAREYSMGLSDEKPYEYVKQNPKPQGYKNWGIYLNEGPFSQKLRKPVRTTKGPVLGNIVNLKNVQARQVEEPLYPSPEEEALADANSRQQRFRLHESYAGKPEPTEYTQTEHRIHRKALPPELQDPKAFSLLPKQTQVAILEKIAKERPSAIRGQTLVGAAGALESSPFYIKSRSAVPKALEALGGIVRRLPK